MREFIRSIVHELEAGRPVCLVSLLKSSGSTPRGTGAMMAVFRGGQSTGTIGGGNVEYTAQGEAAQLLESGESALWEYRFVQGDSASLGMVCGGDVSVHFQVLAPGDKTVAIFRDLLRATAGNTDTWLVRQLDGDTVKLLDVADRSGLRSGTGVPDGILQHQPVFDGSWFAVPVVQAGKVYVFGGGHVSQELVPVIARVGFRPVVYDDRPEFADSALFPLAESTVCGSFLELSEHVTVTPDDYVVVMTRGHQADYEVLTQVLRSGAKYLGCIGSKQKLAFCRDRLQKSGFTDEEYSRLHAPIGLAIGAETPEEIAISIAAELIAVRAGRE